MLKSPGSVGIPAEKVIMYLFKSKIDIKILIWKPMTVEYGCHIKKKVLTTVKRHHNVPN